MAVTCYNGFMPLRGSKKQKWLNQLDRMNYELRQRIQHLALQDLSPEGEWLRRENVLRANELSEGLEAVISLADWIRVTEGL